MLVDPTPHLSRNIHDLRVSYKETQQELAKAINITASSISMYESGTRYPNTQIVDAIAKHYDCPIDLIMYGDFSGLDSPDLLITWKDLIKYAYKLFPVFRPKNDLQNSRFNYAYKTHLLILKGDKSLRYRDLYRTMESVLQEYRCILDENPNMTLCASNILSLLFVYFFSLPDTHLRSITEKVQSSSCFNADFIKQYCLDNFKPTTSSEKTNKIEFIRSHTDEFNGMLYILKQSSNFKDLADYYMALRYVADFVDNDYTSGLNFLIGTQMMVDFSLLGNIYTQRYLNYGKPFDMD